MRKSKRWILCTLAFSFFASLLVPTGQIQAKDESVKVSLPAFKVSLNGHTVDNRYRQYPLLVYRDITYIPMTWNDTRLLGLETDWSPTAGLSIKQSKVTSFYEPNKAGGRNATSYSAQISTTAVTVNGKVINNAKEQYPLLSFRNVRYFPLTWRYAHDEFGWDYKWNAASGLSITSHNPQVDKVDLPTFALENDVVLFKGYYYYVETTYLTNHVYRAPVKQPSNKQKIYSYDHADSRRDSDLIGPFSFEIRENTLWYTYHLGGGVTGSDFYVKIGNDGTTKLMHEGPFLDFRDTPYGTLIIRQGTSAFEGGNLSIWPPGQDMMNSKRVGDSDGRYGVHANYNGGESYAPDSSTTVIGDDVYVLASVGQKDINKILKINLKTNKSYKILDTSVSWFWIMDNKLYYVKDENKSLYSSTLNGTNETKLSEHAVSWFGHIESNLFYTTKIEGNKFALYKVDSDGEDKLVWTTPVTSVQVVNNRLIGQLGGNNGVVVLDGSGSLLVKVADPISHILMSDDQVLLQSSKDSTVKFIHF
ncbi:DUF5050 domain-containing protein [Paenibacillus sp. GCM10023252]|uniref:DUF5050 domain-containing protein n=1 Tax=Paenibacillus sp. GCM10023252 TaxID=3252649 RepID=UPI003622AD36